MENITNEITPVVYHDYAKEPQSEGPTLISKVRNGSNSEQNFPVKLHYMLSDMESDGLGHIVSWQAHGRSFTVNKPKDFVEKILPLWFRQTKLSSFQRQLNLYGFKRITQGPDKGAHYHELFLRGKRFLAHRIPRMKIKGGGPRKCAKPAEEPNFYKLPFLPPHETLKNEHQQQQQQKQQQQVVYQMPHNQVHSHAAVRTQGVNTVLEQALAQQAYLQFTSPHRSLATFTPMPRHTQFPPATSHPDSLAQALGYHSLQDGSPPEASHPHLYAAMREKEIITAALLQRLRRH
mmetsp:Transcript_7895/g.15798  ORF Transcript_7895/g.15798 Transcript_7895/m.15798 type:complete len:291 (-) Transcript_7895:198-1070(-)